MKRWVAMLLILVFTLSGCGLLGGIGETDPAANPVEGNTGTDADYLSLTAELEQARLAAMAPAKPAIELEPYAEPNL